MDNDFVAWLTQELDLRGWTNTELARRAGVAASTVSTIISGLKNPGVDFCVGAARALSIQPEIVMRRASLLPSLPPAIEEEHEVTAILRGLPANVRQVIVTQIRAVGGQRPLPAVSEPRTAYRVEPSDGLEEQLLAEFRNLDEEWQLEAIQEIQRLQRYRTLHWRIIGGEEEEEDGAEDEAQDEGERAA